MQIIFFDVFKSIKLLLRMPMSRITCWKDKWSVMLKHMVCFGKKNFSFFRKRISTIVPLNLNTVLRREVHK